MFWIYGFTLKILERGDLLPIPMTLNSNIFLPTLVNNDQDFMCLQNKPNFKYKLHPNSYQLYQVSRIIFELYTFMTWVKRC